MPVAIATDAANAQHYEVPARFYDLCLGPCKKYSSGLWETPTTTFEESEIAMLDLYCARAQLQDGMSLVDLGCGWGSLTLHLAAKYPHSKITGISNSHSQRAYILQTAAERGLKVENITIVTVRCLLLSLCVCGMPYLSADCSLTCVFLVSLTAALPLSSSCVSNP
jgi:cyclopropane-fatty-acyl-phospholipid synthase